tara:strand:+ start:237 stop:1727 length:1491 start_codon:yes stop_codon:yes gene_type:complete
MSINNSLTIQETFNIAVKNHQEGKTEVAKELYNRVLKIDPNHSQALKNIAIIFINLKDFQKAKECYEKVVEIDPNSADAYYNLGIIFKELKEYQKAKSYYEKADDIQPNNTIILTNLGIIFNDLGENQKAKYYYEKAIKINPDNGKARYNLGAIYKDSGELQKAKICFKKVIEIDPNEQEAHNSLGVIFQELGEYQKAKDCYEKAIEIKPNYGDVYYNLGQLLHEKKEYHLAENYFKKAIQIKPGDMRASNSLLTNLYKMNNQSILFEELDSIINEGKMNAVIGSICSRSEVKYGVKKENPFCNNPLDYVLKKDLNEKYDFKNVIVKCVNNILKDDSISSRVQKLITNGYQTAGNLFANRDFDTNEIQKIIKIEIEKYRLNFKDSKEGFIKNWPTNYNLNGWLISMKKGGKLSAHMHDLGWLSGSIYINVPQKSELESGNLVVCIDENENKNENKKSLDVVTGSLCLFPSSLLHYTIPFESEENRIVLAFDMIPNL